MLDLLLQIFHLFLSVTREAKFLLEAPENGGASLDGGLAEHVMKDHNLVEGKIELKVCTLKPQCLTFHGKNANQVWRGFNIRCS